MRSIGIMLGVAAFTLCDFAAAQESVKYAPLSLLKITQVDSMPGEVETIRASEDGKWLSIGWKAANEVKGGAQLFNAKTLQPFGGILDIGQGGSNSDAVFTPDSKYLVTLSYRSTLRIWDPSRGALVGQGSKSAWDWHLRVHGNSKECVSSGGHPDILRWEIPSGRLISQTNTGYNRIVAMDLSDDGKHLAVIGRLDQNNLHVEVRSYPECKVLYKTTTDSSKGIHAKVAISPDGKRFAFTPPSGNGTLFVADIATGKILKRFAAAFTRAMAIEFIDNRTVICHGWQRPPRMVDIDTSTLTTLAGVVETGGAGMCITASTEGKTGEARLFLGHGCAESKRFSVWRLPVADGARASTPDPARVTVMPVTVMPVTVMPAVDLEKADDETEKAVKPKRAAVPPEELVAKAETELKTLLNITDEGRVERNLPRRLLKLADEEKDATVRYAMLTTAARLARSGQAAEVRQSLDQLTEQFEFNRLRVAGRLLYDVRTRPLASDDKLKLAILAEELGDEAFEAEEIDYASAFYELAIEWSPRDRANLRRRREKGKQIDALLPEFRKAAPSRELINQHPLDADAHQTWGSYLCFVRGKWDAGLALLAKSKDLQLKELAQNDLVVANTPQASFKLGKEWQDFAAKQADGFTKTGSYASARFWLQRAIHDLTGLEKLRAEAALKELPEPTDPPRTMD